MPGLAVMVLLSVFPWNIACSHKYGGRIRGQQISAELTGNRNFETRITLDLFRGGTMGMHKLVFVFALSLPLSAWAQSPFDGTWKFNMSSTQFAEKPETVTLQNGEYTCSRCVPQIALKADGADHKVAGDKDSDTLAV
jgi:hypothetical protein